ncbi:RNA-binding protein [Xylanibacillus composti]|uniref:RNA-binding protein S4 n=1 Tax=Xylanibacillus composti TaxID=1572762 RepID=A0A8J4H3D6_9BACL|nr:YlmH/Sll1252 family protein [Xylanibacillus composti]MDT9724352.1 RNA-binding protein [Xylanibacillus composti]GIQ67943.1 RNA-binding protein S4 [Xylanibacillus composti]
MSSKSNDAIYEHFHPDERHFVDRVQEWVERAGDRHETVRTDFLDPRQIQIVLALANRNVDVAVDFFGGAERAERKRAWIAQDYRQPTQDDFGIALMAIASPEPQFDQLDHGDVLGAVLGLGIKRDKLGDIHLHADRCHLLCAEEMADYIRIHLNQVHRLSVTADRIPLEQLAPVDTKLEELSLSVASLRLDGIVSDVVRVSRAKVLQPIKAGRCKVNWKVEENPSVQLREGDVVSLKGFGRFQVLSIDGVTKSGRMRVKIGKYV